MARARDVAIVGVYTTRQERFSPRTPLSLMMEALNGALDDAGMTIKELDGWLGGFEGGNGRGGAGANVAYQFDLPLHLSGNSSGSAALLEAAAAIREGIVETVAIPMGMSRPALDGRVAPWTRPTNEFTEWTGSITPGQMALQMRRHMHDYGTTLEQMAYGCATVRNNGYKNPDAIMFNRGPLTTEDVLNARIVADPFTLLMCSIVNDGGSCLIVTTAERARDCKKAPVWVLSGASETRYTGYFEAPTLEPLQARGHLMKAFDRAGVTPQDVDLVMLYDHFASGIIMEFEVMGFCEVGEGGPFIMGNIGLDDKYPVCPDGGNQSYSHPGSPMNFKPIEAVRQFRGEVKDLCPGWAEGVHTYDRSICRKVRDPHLAVTCNPLVGGFSYAIVAKE